MANVLATLFKDIASEIRAKQGVGDDVKYKPAEFPEQIAAIETSAGTDDIDDALDVINGEIIGEEEYTVTFIGEDGTVLCTMPAFEGYDCKDPISSGVITTPTKESTKYIEYTFAGWSLVDDGTVDADALSAIESDRTVYVVFTASTIYLADGVCGTGVRWGINPDYVLMVYGSGEMYDYTLSQSVCNSPWFSYATQISAIRVMDGVTALGNYSFYGCSGAVSATLPDGITTIEANCFKNCNALSDVSLPSSLKHIMGSAFSNCTSLTEISIPKAVAVITDHAFSGCSNLTSMIFERTTGWKDWNTREALSDDIFTDPATAAAYMVSGQGQANGISTYY